MWSAKLARPIQIKNGPTLTTLNDAADFMSALPQGHQLRNAWQCAAGLVTAAATEDGSVAEATKQIEDALFLEGRWVPT